MMKKARPSTNIVHVSRETLYDSRLRSRVSSRSSAGSSASAAHRGCSGSRRLPGWWDGGSEADGSRAVGLVPTDGSGSSAAGPKVPTAAARRSRSLGRRAVGPSGREAVGPRARRDPPLDRRCRRRLPGYDVAAPAEPDRRRSRCWRSPWPDVPATGVEADPVVDDRRHTSSPTATARRRAGLGVAGDVAQRLAERRRAPRADSSRRTRRSIGPSNTTRGSKPRASARVPDELQDPTAQPGCGRDRAAPARRSRCGSP